MNDEKLKNQLGRNIAAFRKRYGMTQAALAEKINFSDKAVSKWERGESVPDVLTLTELARLFHITVDDLLKDHNALPENVGRVEKVMGRAVEKTLKRKTFYRFVFQYFSPLPRPSHSFWSISAPGQDVLRFGSVEILISPSAARVRSTRRPSKSPSQNEFLCPKAQ